MLNIVSQIQAALEKTLPIRKLSDAALIREIAALRPLQDILEPKPPAAMTKLPIIAGVIAMAPGPAVKQSLPKSLPVSKGSIYSKRTAAVVPSIPPIALVFAVAANTQTNAPSVDVLAVPVEFRRLLKLRLQLCEAEHSARKRRTNGGNKPMLSPGRVAGRDQPKARKHLWSCAKDVLLDVPAEPASGDCHAKPNSPGNWVRLPLPWK